MEKNTSSLGGFEKGQKRANGGGEYHHPKDGLRGTQTGRRTEAMVEVVWWGKLFKLYFWEKKEKVGEIYLCVKKKQPDE